jgi:DNA-binding LacI/PurR family transcriptional regulator
MTKNNHYARQFNIVDIAEKAGVSRSTVSRVLNNDPYVSDKTRSRVLDVINEVGYSPNVAARMLRTQRTNIIAVVIPDPLGNIFASDNPHYYSAIIQSITEVAQQRDYAMLLWVGTMDEAKDQFYNRILRNRIMDGMLIASSVAGEDALFERLLQIELPFVVIGSPMYYQDQVSYVTIDNRAAARRAVQHLIDQGRKHIATITGDWHTEDTQARLSGYRDALVQNQLDIDEELIVKARYNRRYGYEAMETLLATGKPIDAVFAGSDMIAFGVIDAIHESGLRVPQDISVVGFDDLPSAREFNPPLTSIRQPIFGKAEVATNLLLDQIDNPKPSPRGVILPTELISRASS